MLKVVETRGESQTEGFGAELDELVLEGARRMSLAALEVEVASYSASSTVRLRQRVTKSPGSRKRGLVMAYKLLRMAGER